MSYGTAPDLQAAAYQRLAGDPALAALVGGAIFDAPPSGVLPPLYVVLGEERVRAAGDKTHRGARHLLRVDVVSAEAGFAGAKAAAAAVSDALDGTALTLVRGALVALDFERARARRRGAERRIELGFRAIVEDE